MNRPDLIADARKNGELTAEAEKMIEEIMGFAYKKHNPKRRK